MKFKKNTVAAARQKKPVRTVSKRWDPNPMSL
jgi:hypothetical protein